MINSKHSFNRYGSGTGRPLPFNILNKEVEVNFSLHAMSKTLDNGFGPVIKSARICVKSDDGKK